MVKRIYLQLADLFDAVGTDRFIKEKLKMMDLLNEAEETLSASYIPWRTTEMFNRLYLLNKYANELFLEIVETFPSAVSLPKQLGETARLLARSLENREMREKEVILQPENLNEVVSNLFSTIYDAEAILHEPIKKIEKTIQFNRLSLKTTFLGVFDKNSIVFLSAARFGIITTIAALIAYEFEFVRSYWVPLSCVAVMSGVTIVSTLHRTFQRFFGTVIGIAIAGIILSLDPLPIAIALLVFLFTTLTELFIVKNYGLAALFFTPNALIMAESTSQYLHDFSYIAEARFIDVIIGSVIGLLGVFFMGRRSASSRLPHAVNRTLRSQGQFLIILFSELGKEFDVRKSRERIAMRTNINNLEALYQAAAGEIPSNRPVLESYWSIVYSIKQLGYLLEKCSKDDERPILSEESLAEILYAFEMMANKIMYRSREKPIPIPPIDKYNTIQEEIVFLQKAMKKGAE